MKEGNIIMESWEEINQQLDITIDKIFENYAIHELSEYEKRKIIFDYLCSTLTYDYELLEKIKNAKKYKTPVSRNSKKELTSVVTNSHGICNGISQYYKLLLEKVGIKAHCVICDDGTDVNHQLTLVYSDEKDAYSFDDITGVIVGRGTKEEYFDYNLEQANALGQGNRLLITKQYFAMLPDDYIDYVVGRTSHFSGTLKTLPDNIRSIKNSSTTK